MTTTKSIQSSARNPSSWDPQDDVLLRHLKEVKKLGWKEIAQYFQNRTPNACQFRWRRLKSGNLKTNNAAAVGPVPTSVPLGSGARAGGVNAGTVGAGGEQGGGTAGGNKTNGNEGSGSRRVVGSNTGAGGAAGGRWESAEVGSPEEVSQSGSVGPGGRTDEGKFVKPRAYSLNSAGATAGQRNVGGMLDVNGGVRTQDEENVRLIPKIVIRSRRGSVVQQSQQQHQPPSGTSPSVLGAFSSGLATAFNTPFTMSKARKDSFSSRPRRFSFQTDSRRLSISQVAALTPSRRSSVVMAPTSVSGYFSGRRNSFCLNKDVPNSRRGSLQLHGTSLTSSFADIPRHVSYSHQHLHSGTTPVPAPMLQKPWSLEEDELLQVREERHLSLDELYILLPHRSDQEIQWRLDSISPLVPVSANHSSSGSPFRPVRERSFNDDTAIEEDEDDRNDESKDCTPVDFNSNSTSASNSSTQKNRSSSMYFPKSKETSPTTSESTTRSNTTIPSQNGETTGKILNLNARSTHTIGANEEFHSMIVHHQHNHPQAAATPLPSLNSIFKNVL